MTERNNPTGECPLFSAILTPNRSLSAPGFVIVMTLVGSVSFVSGMVFLLMGAWPVFGFFGLDVLLIYLAFRANYRASEAYEQISVTPTELHVRKVSHRGRVSEWRLNPVWVRIDRDVHPEFGIERLFLISHGRKLPVATFLGADDKESFAAALNMALAEARRGPHQTVVE